MDECTAGVGVRSHGTGIGGNSLRQGSSALGIYRPRSHLGAPMSHPDADFAPAHMIATKTDRSIQGGVDADVAMLALDDVEYSGRYLPLRGKSLLNFGGCSY